MKITTETIKELNPCADRLENFMAHYPEFEGDHRDFLSLENISHADKLWVVLRLMPRFEVEVFAIDCVVSAVSAASDVASDAAAHAGNATDEADAADAAFYAAYAAYAYYATDAVKAAERERQLDVISYLINKSE